MDDNECSICMNDIINTNASCKICQKSTCVNCFLVIINDKDTHRCPFCKNNAEIYTFHKEIINNYFMKKELVLKQELSELKRLYFNLNMDYCILEDNYNKLIKNKRSKR